MTHLYRPPYAWQLAVILLSFTTVACSDDDDPMEPAAEDPVLVGTWSRINSSFQELDGMTVVVDADETEGVVASTPDNPYMFVVGDLKWQNIVRVSVGEYTFEDLVRESGTGAPSYTPGELSLSADGDSVSASFGTGTFQEWVRVN